MKSLYRAEGNKIILADEYTKVEFAECDEPAKAIELFDKAYYLNETRRYTASARLFAQAEALPGFQWLEGCHV